MKSPLTTEIEPATFLFVAQHLNHCATVVPHLSRLHKPSAILSCFQEGAPYSPTWGFNKLPRSITCLRNENLQVKLALKKFLFCVHYFYTVDEFFACTDDMCYWLIWLCKSLHCNNFMCFVCFWHVHIVLSGDRLKALRSVSEWVCVCVCLCV
jgi:hypothetical protein